MSYFPLIFKVLENPDYGRVYGQPTFDFILHQCDFGEVRSKGLRSYQAVVNFILNEESLPQYFHIYNTHPQLYQLIASNEAVGHKYRKRVQLRYQKEIIGSTYRKRLPDGFSLGHLRAHELDLLETSGVGLFKKFWSSKKEFLEMGMPILIKGPANDPACLCYACTVTSGLAEVDVITLPEYRSLGLAKASTEEFIETCLQRGITPNWDCFEENIASLKTAQTFGFTKLREYDFLSVFRKKLPDRK